MVCGGVGWGGGGVKATVKNDWSVTPLSFIIFNDHSFSGFGD